MRKSQVIKFIFHVNDCIEICSQVSGLLGKNRREGKSGFIVS